MSKIVQFTEKEAKEVFSMLTPDHREIMEAYIELKEKEATRYIDVLSRAAPIGGGILIIAIINIACWALATVPSGPSPESQAFAVCVENARKSDQVCKEERTQMQTVVDQIQARCISQVVCDCPINK